MLTPTGVSSALRISYAQKSCTSPERMMALFVLAARMSYSLARSALKPVQESSFQPCWKSSSPALRKTSARKRESEIGHVRAHSEPGQLQLCPCRPSQDGRQGDVKCRLGRRRSEIERLRRYACTHVQRVCTIGVEACAQRQQCASERASVGSVKDADEPRIVGVGVVQVVHVARPDLRKRERMRKEWRMRKARIAQADPHTGFPCTCFASKTREAYPEQALRPSLYLTEHAQTYMNHQLNEDRNRQHMPSSDSTLICPQRSVSPSSNATQPCAAYDESADAKVRQFAIFSSPGRARRRRRRGHRRRQQLALLGAKQLVLLLVDLGLDRGLRLGKVVGRVGARVDSRGGGGGAKDAEHRAGVIRREETERAVGGARRDARVLHHDGRERSPLDNLRHVGVNLAGEGLGPTTNGKPLKVGLSAEAAGGLLGAALALK
eukprot:4999498-Pleurochrysis_carterae.AAC.5